MYLLDANTYIQAHNLHYDMEFCPAYWDWLDQQYNVGVLASITGVYDELASKSDSLSDWVKKRKSHFLPVTTNDIQQQMANIAQYLVDSPGKSPEHIGNFLNGADPWLIARASVMSETIVTYEKLVTDESKKVKIPNVCKHFNVPCINTYELLRTLKARFVLGKSEEVSFL